MKPCRILVAEDDSAAREMVVAFLTLKGHIVSEAIDGAAAVVLAREFQPDVVLTDVCMPHLSGVELCRWLHSDPLTEHTPVVAMTALAIDGWLDLRRAGFEEILEKPLELDELERRLAAACESASKAH